MKLPDFVVLTGVNGSGKSQLLEALENGSIQVDNIYAENNPARPIRKFDWTNLIPSDSAAFTATSFTEERRVLWSQIADVIVSFRNYVSEMGSLQGTGLAELTPRQLLSITTSDLIQRGIEPVHAAQIFEEITSISNSFEQNFMEQDSPNRPRLFSHFHQTLNISLIGLEEKEFYDYFPEHWISIDLFQQSFSRLFMVYQRK